MLSRIRIQGLGVIDDAEVELTPGLNVLTGETGAGKTMVVTGLGLLLGARADSGLVRAGARSAVVEGEVVVPPHHPAAQRVTAAGGDAEDGLVLVRTVAAGGRSRAHVGGRAAPVSVLADVGEHLVAVHGQADQWRLRAPEEHRALLDAFGGAAVSEAAAGYRTAYQRWRRTREELARVSTRSAERVRHAELLRAALEQIEAVDPREGEEEELRGEAERLAHADALREAAALSHAVLVGDEAGTTGSALEAVGRASASLTAVSRHDGILEQLADRVREVGYLLTDIATELAGYASSVDVDPARLAWVQQRQADIAALLRRYGPSTGEVLRWARESAAVVAEVDGADELVARLTSAEARQRAEVGLAGARLGAARGAAAGILAGQVQAELAHLAMPGARIDVHVGCQPDRDGVPVPEPGGMTVRAWAHGLDEVEIRLAANTGAPPRSLTRAASGGELSRVMLALEVVGSRGEVPTYVFDEVDAGVGGAAALDLGARLARLAEHAQVLVVTHLGQVAAFADQHLVVTKSSDGQVTASDVHAVTGQDRVAEVARMLGGVAESEAALRHARELVEEHAPRHRRAAPA